MGFLEQVRTRWAKFSLKPNSLRKKKVVGLKNAQRIGVLYDATDRDLAELVRVFVTEQREAKRNVVSLGFVKVKYEEEVPKARLGFDYFGTPSLNFALKSSDRSVTKFISQDFDVLLDLNMDADPILLHIVAATHAGFVVGISDEGKPFRDLVFELGDNEKNTAAIREARIKKMQALIENIKKYVHEL